jgi:ferric-dicitrate binding protein FerR (iron transport regulator)
MENVNDTQKIHELLDSFAEGTITSSDFIQLKNWINESEAHRADARHALQLDAALMVEAGKPDIDVDAAISRFHDYIGDKKAKTIPLWAKIAAAVALVLIVVLPYVAYHAGTDSVKETFADVRLEAPAGSQLNMTLPDGTKIRLNSGSVISYSQGFGITDRTVNLEGEAFFEVKHNKNLSFTVKTKELSVKDLGTSFLFSNYKDEPTAKVELFDGKVSLDNELTHTEGLLLTPGQCAVMDKKSGMLTTSKVTITKEEAKSQSNLTFVNMPLTDIARVLSRSYGQSRTVTHSAGKIKFYGQFSRQKDNLQDILKSMSETGKIHYKKENGKYVLYQ